MFHPMMSWALGRRPQRRRILACSLLLAVLACAAVPGASEASRKFRGQGFSTRVPTSWKIDKPGRAGATRIYNASSRQTKRNTTVNSTLMTVNVVPVADLERQLAGSFLAPTRSCWSRHGPAAAGAERAGHGVVRGTILGGRPAASGAANFFLGGATVLQSDTISIYRGRVYILQFYVDQNVQYQGLTTCAACTATGACTTGVRGQSARARSFARTSSENCGMKRAWSAPGPWNTGRRSRGRGRTPIRSTTSRGRRRR